MKSFKDFGISLELQRTIKKLGFEIPTPIQEKTIPFIIQGRDVIGESATGSGKTLAFGAGIIEKAETNKGLQALVLTPTRELAEQVKESLVKFSYKQLNIFAIYGGVAIEPQIKNLQKADIIVSTPGRLLDHLSRRTIDLSKVKFLVLDEADRMFDMGFIDDVEKILQNCPKKRQTLFFSATISPRVKKLASKHMHNPAQISASKQVDPSKLKQIYYDVSKELKLSLLIHLLNNEKSGLIMIFCNTRKTTDFIVKALRGNKMDAIAIHGGLSQNKRTNTINQFNKGKVLILVCTDVAARGLHIDNVSHIYNYGIPRNPSDYVHRIGRTARAGEEGKVINLLCDYDYDNFRNVKYEYRSFNIEKVEVPELKQINAFFGSESRRHPRPRQNSFRHRRKPSHSRRYKK
jgi:superfamily II DNA/RNA helicase